MPRRNKTIYASGFKEKRVVGRGSKGGFSKSDPYADNTDDFGVPLTPDEDFAKKHAKAEDKEYNRNIKRSRSNWREMPVSESSSQSEQPSITPPRSRASSPSASRTPTSRPNRRDALRGLQTPSKPRTSFAGVMRTPSRRGLQQDNFSTSFVLRNKSPAARRQTATHRAVTNHPDTFVSRALVGDELHSTLEEMEQDDDEANDSDDDSQSSSMSISSARSLASSSRPSVPSARSPTSRKAFSPSPGPSTAPSPPVPSPERQQKIAKAITKAKTMNALMLYAVPRWKDMGESGVRCPGWWSWNCKCCHKEVETYYENDYTRRFIK